MLSKLRERQDLAVADGEGAVEEVADFGLGGDAQRLEDGGVEVGGGAGLGFGEGGVAVGAAVDLASTDTAAGEGDRVGIGIVVAAGVGVDARGATEIGQQDDERFIERSSVGEVLQQRGDRAIEHR